MAEVPDGVAVWGELPPPPLVIAFIAARLGEQPPGAAVDALRDLVEWAVGVEELRRWRDPSVPGRPVGLEVLGVIAAAWSDHPDYEPGWDLLG